MNQPTDTRILASERKWLLGFSLVVALFTSLPYLLGIGAQGNDWRFSGFVFGIEDGNSYIAKMLSGAAGDWLFRTPYTSLEQDGFLAFSPYILLGKLSAPPAQHEQLLALYHIYRVAAGLLAILATYDFVALFIREIKVRRMAIMLITLGGGLGWVLVLFGVDQIFGSPPLEFYSPETFGFLSLYGLPHLAAARALLLWGIRSYLIYGRANRVERVFARSPLRSTLPGWLFLGIGFFQPLTIVIGWAVIGAHGLGLLLLNFRQIYSGSGPGRAAWSGYFRQGVITVLISAPFVIYTFAAFSLDPFLRAWQKQNLILSPHPIHYVFAYGLLMPGAILTVVKIMSAHKRTGENEQHIVLAAWVFLFPFLAYAPYGLQRRLPEGVWVAIVILALLNINLDLLPRLGLYSLVGATLPSTLILVIGGMIYTREQAIPTYRPASEVDAFLTLAESAKPGEVVLSSYSTGNALPTWAPLAVVIGHGPESAGLAELEPLVAAFFQQETSDQERLNFILDEQISYIFWGPSERALGDWNPGSALYLREIIRVDEYAVFRVRRETPGENP